MTDAEAFAELGLTGREAWPAIRAAYLEAARRTHPDAGGDASAFARAAEACRTLEAGEPARAIERARCRACEGKGKRETRSGWQALVMPCDACGGTGKRHGAC
jgi:DnaJ-class molecular chaperone